MRFRILGLNDLNKDAILEKIRNFILKYQSDLSFAHGYDHSERVRKLALLINEKEGGDQMVLEIASLLHDIGYTPLASLKREMMLDDNSDDHKIFFEKYFMETADHHQIGAIIAKNLMKEIGLSDEKIEKICQVIREYGRSPSMSLESKILNDADVLERYGATWIARAFQRTNAFDRKLGIESVIRNENYIRSSGKPRFTKTAQQIMEKRMEFQNKFIKQLIEELELRS